MPLELFVSRRTARGIERVVQWWRSTGQQLQALYVKISKQLSIFCLCSQTSGFASGRRVHPTCGAFILIASDIGSTAVFEEIASKSCQCGIQVAAAVPRSRDMTLNLTIERDARKSSARSSL